MLQRVLIYITNHTFVRCTALGTRWLLDLLTRPPTLRDCAGTFRFAIPSFVGPSSAGVSEQISLAAL
ncbi:hypothetical protein SCLCIDRAFT_1102924 [Scleroderma citrinum Foug A]|uniref:Uncharacterized protein n=1 Tax=Scleroderma citrinum Foug A TaxID=1036808 RepID=A0A0C3DP59_9AGAM|nr:hypothetical protein SCLCIDRAFT_1102924 [Scleroderma citrinum Foug A]